VPAALRRQDGRHDRLPAPAQRLDLTSVAHPMQPAVQAQFAGPCHRTSAVLKTLGAALYRAGKYDTTVQRLNEAIAAQGKGGHAIDFLFLAMAQHRLGRHDDASKSFAKAVSLMDAKASAALTWEGRLEWDVVRKEAVCQAKGR
jgi:hypothetical protein